MSHYPFTKKLGLLAIPLLLMMVSVGNANGQCGPHGCGPIPCPTGHCREKCQWLCCPPHLKHCMERPPRICFWPSCPKPICTPCEAPNWGYFQTCWTPWPWPPDYSHCPVTPPAALIPPAGYVAREAVPRTADGEGQLPAPRKIDR